MANACFRFLLAITFSFMLISAEATPNTSPLPPTQMLKQVLPSIVNIKSYGFLPANITLDDEEEPQSEKQNTKPHHFVSAGSGIIINAAKGYVITNAHVIKDADKIVVTLKDGQQYAAEKVGVDEPSDIALLKITAPNLTDITIANSNNLDVGDKVYAIGNPFGLGTSVTSGIVSALERTNLSIETYENFIQIDASINPGNSGGALVNASGEIVGMNTAIITSENGGGNIGIGFAIPSNMLTAVIPQLIKYGKVERGIMGILAQTFSTPLANAMHMPKQEGAIVSSVMPFSPAEEAGIQIGDVITHIDDVAISTASQVVNTVGFLRTDTVVKIKLLRQGKPLELSITLMDAKKQQALVQKHTPYFNGVSLQNSSFYSPENGHVNGVALVHVKIDSAAWIAGLRTGDVVLSANGISATSVKKLQQTIAKAKETLTLLVLRNHGTAFIVLTPEGASND
ncbi:MAG: trypsin-like peptidase domain-containing protein [Pseudomonadota bacterium]